MAELSENQLRKKIGDAANAQLGGPKPLCLDADEVFLLRNLLTYEHAKRLPHYGMEQFVEHAWQKIFAKLLQPEKKRRWSYRAKLSETTLRIYEIAARVIVQFERNGGHVSYITHDRDAHGDNFGILSYEGHHNDHRLAFEEIVGSARVNEATFLNVFQYDKKQGIG